MAAAGQMSVTQMYRRFLLALRTYPSSKRAEYIVAVKEEFHANSTVTDPVKAAELRQMALMELERLQRYSGMSTSGPDIDLKL
jgi:hypothetical protein